MLPDLGLGIVYSSGLEPLIEARPELFDVIEVEPQTLWLETGDAQAPYRIHPGAFEHLATLPGHKLVHSVGTPVGGSVRAHRAQIPLLRQAITMLASPWASEHLSFNLTRDFFTGFFLPPRQTSAGVQLYADAVSQLQDDLGVPVAIETPVNYLRPRGDEMPDGDFVASVADRADSGILLDLHNLYCNERNGRLPVREYVASLPRERVWEVHVAGGFELGGYWLDAHSGAVPDVLMQIAAEVLPTLPCLKAMIFELFPSFLPTFGLDAAAREMERLRELWRLRGIRSGSQASRPRAESHPSSAPSPGHWEDALGKIVIGRTPMDSLERELAEDPGSGLMRGLVKEFRGSMVVGVYRLSCRLLMLALGRDAFQTLLEDFWSKTPPHQFAASEGDAFADYLRDSGLQLPQLHAVLEFERATLATLRDGQRRVVCFASDPFPLLRALNDGELPVEPGAVGEFEIEIVDDGPFSISVNTGRAASPLPFH